MRHVNVVDVPSFRALRLRAFFPSSSMAFPSTEHIYFYLLALSDVYDSVGRNRSQPTHVLRLSSTPYRWGIPSLCERYHPSSEAGSFAFLVSSFFSVSASSMVACSFFMFFH
eukprot:gnl/TRDRNA2_/TRDRNA2_76604_c0_seq1.p1 gnl/TRDRNA2_/TRDRNA2_76604_c0~~gnl/TRDRNA2_/TRDRNA2_76604_c0_seq1.p1  ORF type:complete len:112 (-),score=2.94 gnl/TRDRNA2_/TRDRNA2_76604_c0_seq1:110-445(-)